MGRLYHAQDLFDEAHEEYEKWRRIEPEHYACLYGLAQTLVEKSQHQEAIVTLEALRKKYSDKQEVLKLLTYVYLQTQHREAAPTAQAMCALAQSAEDVEAWSMLAEAHEQMYAAGEE